MGAEGGRGQGKDTTGWVVFFLMVVKDTAVRDLQGLCEMGLLDNHNGRLTEDAWIRKFDKNRAMAQKALAIKDTVVFVGILFDWLYVLRNQLVHGGATWKSKVNRDQVRDGSRILQDIVPAIIHIIMENPSESWGKPCYPPV